MILALLGRQPALGVAELERVFDAKNVSWFSAETALISATDFSVEHFGGIQKAGKVIAEAHGSWQTVNKKIVQTYTARLAGHEGKITLGISAYGFSRLNTRDIQKTGLTLKSQLKKSGTSVRLIPNTDTALNSATSHHNKLGLSNNKIELIVVQNQSGKILIAESLGAQNITSLARRDQSRPKRDAFVGMLPPKLALQMVNLALGPSALSTNQSDDITVLDPFCGTGVVLQESLLRRFYAYGTDLSDKMIDYSQANLEWLKDEYHLANTWRLAQGDAMTTVWQSPITAVACESYLGQPFSAPPSPAKLTEVRGNCNHIISTFLKNIASQLVSGTPLCIGVPAWRDNNGDFTHLPLIDQLEKLGYVQIPFKNVRPEQLLYYREDQVVARELLVIQRI